MDATIAGVRQTLRSTLTCRSPRLLISTATSTTILHLEPDVTEAEVSEDVRSRRTLTAGLVKEHLVQVTSQGVQIWSDIGAGTTVGQWSVEGGQEIVTAQVHSQLVLVAARRGELSILAASGQGLELIM